MMAYLIDMRSTCIHWNCKYVATHKVYNRRNESMGKYCKQHAEERVAEMKKEEEVA